MKKGSGFLGVMAILTAASLYGGDHTISPDRLNRNLRKVSTKAQYQEIKKMSYEEKLALWNELQGAKTSAQANKAVRGERFAGSGASIFSSFGKRNQKESYSGDFTKLAVSYMGQENGDNGNGNGANGDSSNENGTVLIDVPSDMVNVAIVVDDKISGADGDLAGSEKETTSHNGNGAGSGSVAGSGANSGTGSGSGSGQSNSGNSNSGNDTGNGSNSGQNSGNNSGSGEGSGNGSGNGSNSGNGEGGSTSGSGVNPGTGEGGSDSGNGSVTPATPAKPGMKDDNWNLGNTGNSDSRKDELDAIENEGASRKKPTFGDIANGFIFPDGRSLPTFDEHAFGDLLASHQRALPEKPVRPDLTDIINAKMAAFENKKNELASDQSKRHNSVRIENTKGADGSDFGSGLFFDSVSVGIDVNSPDYDFFLGTNYNASIEIYDNHALMNNAGYDDLISFSDSVTSGMIVTDTSSGKIEIKGSSGGVDGGIFIKRGDYTLTIDDGTVVAGNIQAGRNQKSGNYMLTDPDMKNLRLNLNGLVSGNIQTYGPTQIVGSGIVNGRVVMSGNTNDEYLIDGVTITESIMKRGELGKVIVKDATIMGFVDISSPGTDLTISHSTIFGDGENYLVGIMPKNAYHKIIIEDGSYVFGGINTRVTSIGSRYSLWLKDSVVSGNINFDADDKDSILDAQNSMIDGSLYVSPWYTKITKVNFEDSILTGSYNQTGKGLSFSATNSFFFQSMDFGDGDNSIAIAGSEIDGAVMVGKGNDTFCAKESLIKGNVNIGAGNNTVVLEKSSLKDFFATGDGNDKVTVDGSILAVDVNLGAGNNTLDIKNSAIGGDVVTGSNTGDENTISISDGTLVLGSLVGGAGNESMSLADTVIGGRIELGNGENYLSLDADSYIFGGITAGSGDDTLLFSGKPNETKYYGFDVDLGDGDNAFTIEGDAYINSDIKGGTGIDALTFGASSSDEIIFAGNLSGVETVTINGDATIRAKSHLLADTILLNGDKTWLEVDPTKKDGGKIIGHGLYGNTGTITLGPQSHLIVQCEYIDDDAEIIITGTLNAAEGQVVTNSIVHNLEREADGSLKVSIVDQVPEGNDNYFAYPEITQVYRSCFAASAIPRLAHTASLYNKPQDTQVQDLYSYLEQIYANNVYSYVPKLAFDGLETYREAYLGNRKNLPVDGSWTIDGIAIATTKSDHKDFQSGSFSNGYLKKSPKYGYDASTTGLLAMLEHLTPGSSNNAVGFVFGGSKVNANMMYGSKISGTSLYLGVNDRFSANGLSFNAGIGTAFNSYAGKRNVATSDRVVSDSAKFDGVGIDAYLSTEKFFDVGPLTLVPQLGLSYSYAKLGDITEYDNPAGLPIEVSSDTFGLFTGKAGLSLRKDWDLTDSRISLYATGAYLMRSGDTRYDLRGKIKGSDATFPIAGDRQEGGAALFELGFDWMLGASLDLFGVGAYELGSDDNTASGKIGVRYHF
jgi:hypothetical protein